MQAAGKVAINIQKINPSKVEMLKTIEMEGGVDRAAEQKHFRGSKMSIDTTLKNQPMMSKTFDHESNVHIGDMIIKKC